MPWLLVDAMNRCFDPVLIETLKGWQSGAGAKVSATGLVVLEAYRKMERKTAAIAERPAYARLRT